MTAVRVLHLDDEPDIRHVVNVPLGLEPEFEVRACASRADALVVMAMFASLVKSINDFWLTKVKLPQQQTQSG